MRVDDLRPLALFDGAHRRRSSAELLAVGADDARSSRASSCSARASTRTTGGCWSTARSSCSARRPRGDRGRPDGRAGPLGRRVPGLGRARRLPRDRTRRRDGRLLQGARRRAARPGRARGSRSAVHLIQGLYGTARTIESTARQRESLVTLGTLAAGPGARAQQPGRRRRPRRRRAGDDAATTLLASLGRLADGDDHRPSSSCALDELRREISRAAAGARPAGAGRRRGRAGRLARATTASTTAWTLAAPLAAARRRRRVVRARRGSCSMAQALRARSGVGGQHPVGAARCSPRCARRPAGSPSWSAPCGRTRRWTAPPCSPSTSPRASRARW